MPQKILIDLGAHHGNAIEELKPLLPLDNRWEIHMFEPNPACELSERMKNSAYWVHVHSSAAWVEDGVLDFSQQNHRIAKNGSPTDGRSDIDGWGSRVSSVKTRHPALLPPIKVPCIDLAAFIRTLGNESFLAVKMDIEGAEFAVLRHLIAQKVISRLDVLIVEWHVRLMEDEDMNSRQILENQIRGQGVRLVPWH